MTTHEEIMHTLKQVHKQIAGGFYEMTDQQLEEVKAKLEYLAKGIPDLIKLKNLNSCPF